MDEGLGRSPLSVRGLNTFFKNESCPKDIVANMTINGISPNPTKEELREHEQIEMRKSTDSVSACSRRRKWDEKKHNMPIFSSRGTVLLVPDKKSTEGMDGESYKASM